MCVICVRKIKLFAIKRFQLRQNNLYFYHWSCSWSKQSHPNLGLFLNERICSGSKFFHLRVATFFAVILGRIFTSLFLSVRKNYSVLVTSLIIISENKLWTQRVSLTLSVPNFRRHLSSAFFCAFFHKLSPWKRFMCTDVKQRRSRWDGLSGSMLFAQAYYYR